MRIGLALGSGAARGWAHIGVINALKALNIPIDVIAGCSIGAYVGAAHASGRLERLEDWALSLTDWHIFRLVGLGFHRGSLATGSKVFEKHKEFSLDAFEEMSIPFACVATDLYRGTEVVFDAGAVSPAIQASCAIPALFAPVEKNGRWLIDGAAVNPVPVNICRQLGADFVIAVNLSSDYIPSHMRDSEESHKRMVQRTNQLTQSRPQFIKQWFSPDGGVSSGDAPGIMSVMSGALSILQNRVARSRLAGEPPDIIIEPYLSDVALLEFNRAEELVERGKHAVERLERQLCYLVGGTNCPNQ